MAKAMPDQVRSLVLTRDIFAGDVALPDGASSAGFCDSSFMNKLARF
jgi:hypothetical protein